MNHPNKSKVGKDGEVFKGSPAPSADQAVESGDPTLTGSAKDKAKPNAPPAEPKEGAHWESGRQAAE